MVKEFLKSQMSTLQKNYNVGKDNTNFGKLYVIVQSCQMADGRNLVLTTRCIHLIEEKKQVC